MALVGERNIVNICKSKNQVKLGKVTRPETTNFGKTDLPHSSTR